MGQPKVARGEVRGVRYFASHRVGRGIGAPDFNIGLDGYFLFNDRSFPCSLLRPLRAWRLRTPVHTTRTPGLAPALRRGDVGRAGVCSRRPIFIPAACLLSLASFSDVRVRLLIYLPQYLYWQRWFAANGRENNPAGARGCWTLQLTAMPSYRRPFLFGL